MFRALLLRECKTWCLLFFLRLMRYNKFLRVLRLIKRPRKSGMRRRRRRNSIIPWIMLF